MAVQSHFRNRSSSFRTLERELKTLRRHLLPAQRSATGVYPKSTYTRVYGYRVLAHAEFEFYFEERAKELCKWSVDRWKNSQKASRVIASLLSYYGYAMSSPKANREQWLAEIDFIAHIEKASTVFHAGVANNHGIKEQNIIQLLLPIGIDPSDLDNVWLANIEAFGRSRGSIAHQSPSAHRITSLPDPFSELQTVGDLLNGTKDLDEKMNALKR